MTSIISSAEAEKRSAMLQDMNKPQRLTVSEVRWKDGSSHPQGATVILSNGRLLDCQVHNVVPSKHHWCVEVDIEVKFNDYSALARPDEEALRVADLQIPQSGKLQGTQVVLNDGSYLSLIHSIRFADNGLRVKVRVDGKTPTTSTEATNSQTKAIN